MPPAIHRDCLLRGPLLDHADPAPAFIMVAGVANLACSDFQEGPLLCRSTGTLRLSIIITVRQGPGIVCSTVAPEVQLHLLDDVSMHQPINFIRTALIIIIIIMLISQLKFRVLADLMVKQIHARIKQLRALIDIISTVGVTAIFWLTALARAVPSTLTCPSACSSLLRCFINV